MVSLWASPRALLWLYVFSFTVLVLWLHQSVKRGQVSCVRPGSNVGSLSPVPGATFCRRGREPVSVLLAYRRLVNHSIWSRHARAACKSAATLGNGDETFRTASSLDNEDEKLLPGWRFSRLLFPASGSRRTFEGRKTSRDICLPTLNECPSGSYPFFEDGRTSTDFYVRKPNECPSELLRHSIAQVKHVQAGAWPHIAAALASNYAGTSWNLASEPWQRRARPFGLQVFYKEAGGGGDCMYHAIAASLEEVGNVFPALKGLTAQSVRNAAAMAYIGSRNLIEGKAASKKEEDDFLENLTVLAALEDGKSWDDRWSPGAILREKEYVNSAGQKMATDTTAKKAQALFFELSRAGTSHLGTHSDLGPLGNALNVGFIVLHERGSLYAIAANTAAAKPVYSLLYFREGGHFQVAGIGNEQTGVRSAFRAGDVPDFLHCIHIVDCHSAVYPTGTLVMHNM